MRMCWKTASIASKARYVNSTCADLPLFNLRSKLALFDVALHENFFNASRQKRGVDLRRLLRGSLVERCPDDAVLFVDNHDTVSWPSALRALLLVAGTDRLLCRCLDRCWKALFVPRSHRGLRGVVV